MTHPGVGPITALATEVFLGDPARFANSKELASCVGMMPGEYSSGKRHRLGGLTKAIPCCDFCGVKQRSMRYAGIQS
jgi:transposase